MDPEVIFLRYAFPCAFILQTRKDLSKGSYDKLENAAIKGKVLPRGFLEKSFPKAFERIELLSKEISKDKWDAETIREYFVNRHNNLIDRNMFSWKSAPETLKDLCKVQKANIIDVKGGCYIVKIGSRIRPVIKDFVPDLKKGDGVMIHYGYAVES